MNDKERILMLLLDRLYSTQFLCLGGHRESQFDCRHSDNQYVHFGGYDDRPIQPGDLVMGKTGNISDFKIAWVVKVVDESTCILREIGSNRLCNYGNESFVRIVGLHPSLLREGDQYQFEQKVIAAFARGDAYWYRYGGVEFDGYNVTIWVREAFGGLDKPSKPFSVTMRWNKRTSIKRILETMIAGGYGTKKFELAEDPNAAQK